MSKSQKFPKTTYGDYGLPFYGAIYNRDLKFPNSNYTKPRVPTISVKNIINPRQCENFKKANEFGKYSSKYSKYSKFSNYYKSKYGSIWYPHKFIDLNYNPSTGGYINSNGPLGPYFALGLGNYPRSMYQQVYFGGDKRSRSPEKYKPYRHSVFQTDADDEEEQIQDILNDPYTKHGDIIQYQSNNQQDNKTYKRIFRDRQGNLRTGEWRGWIDPDENYFGKKRNSTKSTKSKGPKGPKGPKSPKGPKGPKGPKRKTSKSKIVYCLPKEQKFPVNTKKRCSAALSYARYAPEPCDIARCVRRHCKKYPTVGMYSKLMQKCK
jgi:hypothetical protein